MVEREGGRVRRKKRKEHDTHSTQEAFSHSTSCITHEVLTEQRAHSPFPLAVSGWQSTQARMNKLFRPSSLSFSLFLHLCLSRLWHRSPGPEVTTMETGSWREGLDCSHGQCWSWARPPSWLCWWSWLSAWCPLLQSSELQWVLCLDSLTDLNLNTREPGESALCAYITPSQHLHPLSLSLLVCFAKLSWFVSHPSLLRISFLTFPSVSLSLPLFPLSLPIPLQLCSLLFSHVSLSVSPSLSFWDSIRALEAGERKQGV